MSFATRNRLVTSTSARLSAQFGALLVLAFALMGIAIVSTTNEMTTYELRGPLLLEAAFVREVVATEGLTHAIEDINLRTAHSALIVHRLDDANGRILAGNPALSLGENGWSTVDLPHEGAPARRVFLLTEDVGAGARLAVGIELSWSNAVRDATLRRLALIGVIVLFLALAIGFLSTNVTFDRMRAIWQSLRAVSAGDLSARAPVRRRNTPDDIDALALRFNEMMDNTDRLVANLKRVSTNVAHDLRMPLTHLSHRLERARSAADFDIARQEIGHAQDKIDEIMRMLDSTLHLAELESGALRRSLESISLASVVERVLDAYRPQFEERGASLVGEIGQIPAVRGSTTLIARALANLLDNTQRHASDGREVRVTLKTEGDQIVLAVEDEGPGLSPDDIETALRPFGRLDKSRGAPGFGLGLSIVSAIATLHDAELRIENLAPGLRVAIHFAGSDV